MRISKKSRYFYNFISHSVPVKVFLSNERYRESSQTIIKNGKEEARLKDLKIQFINKKIINEAFTNLDLAQDGQKPPTT